MGSIKKLDTEVEIRVTAEELVLMTFQVPPGVWDVGSAIGRACANKVVEKAATHPELADLKFDLYKIVPGKGEFVVYLRIEGKTKDPLAGVI